MIAKRFLSLVLSLCIILTVATFPAMAATTGTTTEGLAYSISNNKVTITDYTGSATSLTIPSTIEGYPVTTIGNEAFSYRTSLTSITIPNSVTSIGDSAFYECSTLKSINIPDSVTSIGNYAFAWCGSLTSITIPDSVTTIGDYAFYNCRSLTSITIPDSVTEIGTYAFSNCDSLESVTIGDSVTEIGTDAFSNCDSLTSVTIPDSVTSIGDYAFSSCTRLTSITIPNSVTTIGGGAFYNCYNLTSITIPNSVTYIGYSAFDKCNDLQNVYYIGTKEQKNNISFNNNSYLTNATWHYFDVVCDTECNDCGAIREVFNHVYVDACDEECDACGETRTAPHYYDNHCDTDCNACGAVREPEPHFVGERDYEIVNDATYPYSFTDGWYTSTNKTNKSLSTLTLIAKEEFTLNVRYKVSSEKNCDYLTIKKNNSWLINDASGNVLETTLPVTLSAGDTLVFTYSKDGSGNVGSDTASFTFEPNIVNAEDVEADCSNAVICSGCGIIVKPIDPNKHTYAKACDTVCAHCGATREAAPIGVTASKASAGEEFTADKAIDKIESTCFKTSTAFGAGDGVKSIVDLVFDFGKPVNLTEMYTQWGSCRLTNGVVYGANSADATEWTPLCTIESPTYTTKDYGSGFTQEISHEGYYRYIKLSVTKIAVGGKIALYEASFKGDSDNHVYTSDLDYKCNECGYERFAPTPASNFKYSKDSDRYGDEYITITGFYGIPTNLIIPETIEGLPVKYIYGGAFSDCIYLMSVVIPDSVTSIGDSAFSGCTALTNITIPDSVTEISHSAFSGCRSLTSITLGDSVTSIYPSAFYNCSSLTSITIPDGVTTIGSSTFSGCSSLTSITIPDSVTSIYPSAFYNCSSLVSITIPDSVTYIDAYAFQNCSSLTSITIGDSVTEMGKGAFQNCSSLTSITIPDSVTSIGDSAFAWCDSLTSITIPASVGEIGYNPFSYCSSLSEIKVDEENPFFADHDGMLYNKDMTALVACPGGKTECTMPGSVAIIVGGAFSGCTALDEIIVDEENQYYSSVDGVIYNKDKTSLILCVAGASGHVTIPDTVTTIESGSFAYCSSLTSITIPASVTVIEPMAFQDHGLIESVYYYGNAEQREKMNIGEYNWGLTGASWYSGVCLENGGHTYSNLCDSSCNVCGETRYVSNHVFSGRCDPDCNICGMIIEAIADHYYTDDTDVSCNECGYIRFVENAPTFSVESKTAKAGNTFTVAVSTKNNIGIVSLKLKVGYDAEVLELVNIEEADFADASFGAITKNPITILWEDVLSDNNITNGTVALLTFKVKDTAVAGTTEITITYDPEDVYNYGLQNVEFAVENGTISVIEYISGDVNADGEINNKDLGILRRYLNEWEVEIDELASDVNRDGKVNNKDLGLLRRYLNDWDVELK